MTEKPLKYPATGSTQLHGHPRFYEILADLAKLHSDKNHDYAAGGNPLGNFMRRADLYSKYLGLDLSDPVVVALVDSQKQLDAALWFLSNKHEARVEGLAGRLKDVAVYAVLAMILEEEKRKANWSAIKAHHYSQPDATEIIQEISDGDTI